MSACCSTGEVLIPIQAIVKKEDIKLKQEAPVTRSLKKWSNEADAKLQDSFASTHWNMFRDSSNGIEEYTTSVYHIYTTSIHQ